MKTGDNINFAQFEQGDLVENERNTEECESISDSTDESYTENDSYDGYISINSLKDIWDGSQLHLELNAINNRLKIRDHIKLMKNEWKVA